MCSRLVGMNILFAAFSAAFSSQININTATRGQLDSLGLLTPFKIESILDYRERYGDILSATELSLVDGFTEEDIEAMETHVSFDPAPPENGGMSHTITTRVKKKYNEGGIGITGKYDLAGKRLTAAFTIDNDPGERFPDFISGFISGRFLTVGDYSARFGQGLVMWNGMAFNSLGEPSAQKKTQSGIKGYRGSDESDFQRGLALRLKMRRSELSVFASFNGKDARLVDTGYTSISTTGLHVSETERMRKSSMHEYLAGANFTRTFGTWQVGITGIGYFYDKPNASRVTETNRIQRYDGLWGNVGINFFGSAGNFRFYGEAASDAHLAPAAVAGVLWRPGYALEMGLQSNYYSPAYIATHSSGTTHDSFGIQYSARVVLEGWQFNGNIAWNLRPFRQESALKYRIAARYTFDNGIDILYQLRNGSHRLNLIVPAGGFTGTLRAEGKLSGYAFYLEAGWKARKWEVSARATYYNTKDWDSRVYLYEKDVPQSFSTHAYYGKGWGAYLYARCSPFRLLDCWIKVSKDYLAAFIRIFIPG